MRDAYESPRLTKVGSLKDLTLGEGVRGNDDVLLWFIRWGTNPSLS